MTENERLWGRWRTRRDADAFAALVRTHLAPATDAARRCGSSAEDAEDAVQDALVRLAKLRDNAPLEHGVRAWLIRETRGHARSERRSRRRRARREVASQPLRVRQEHMRPELQDEVDAALLRLPDPEREAVVLRYLHDLDYKEIAHVLDASENACRLRVHHAIGRLKRSLGSRATALVAALTLAAPRSEAALINAATHTALSGTVAATGGAIAMTTTSKLAAAALLGSALTAAGLFTSDAVFSTRSTPERAPGSGRVAGRGAPGPSRSEASGNLFDDATPGEVELLRATLRQERHRRQEARIRADDSGLDILRRVIEHDADASELVRDFDRMSRRVRIGGAAPIRVDAAADETPTSVDLDELVARGGRIEFGPGRFVVTGSNDFAREDRSVLEIVGAGRDRTTLVWKREVMIRKDIENLRIADVSIVSLDHELLDIRGRAAVLMENVRLEGWWPSAGHGAAIGLSGGVYFVARNCQFLGGRSSTDDLGDAFSIRGTAVAGFFACEFVDLDESISGWSKDTAQSEVHLTDCLFENAPVTRGLLRGGTPQFPLHVTGGRVRYGSAALADEERRARWGVESLATLEGVAFEPGPTAEERGYVLRDLFAAAGAVTPREHEVLTAVHLPNRTRNPRIALGFYNLRTRRERVVVIQRGAGGWEELETKMKARVPHVRKDRAGNLLGLIEAVRGAGLAASDPVVEIRYESAMIGKTWSYAVVIERRRTLEQRTIRLDGRSGERIER